MGLWVEGLGIAGMSVHADHLPQYRQEAIFGRAGLAIPRSSLAQCVGSCGVQLQPLVDAMKAELLQHRVLHADETPASKLKPGNGKTHRAYLWAYGTGAFEIIRVGRLGLLRITLGRTRPALPGGLARQPDL
jgi:Transposase IS66 family